MSPLEPRIPLPKSWPTHVRAAILHVIALSQFATAHTRSWALVAGKPGVTFTIRVDFQEGRRHLPVVTLKRAA